MDPGRSLSSSQEFLTPKPLVRVDSDVILILRLMEEREGEDGDGENGWRNTSVFAMILSQNISFHDKILLSGKIERVHALTWFAYPMSDRAKSSS